MNFLLIVADDMRYDELAYMPKTRRLMCGKGTTYTGCRTNCSVCGPTRAGLLTGQLSKHHGVTTAAGVPASYDDSMYEVLNDAGYRVGHVGKFFHGLAGNTQRAGFDFWRALGTTATASVDIYEANNYSIYTGATSGQPYGDVTPGIYQDHYLCGQAIDFIRGTEPWFLQYMPTSNHSPWDDPPEHTSEWAYRDFPLDLETTVTDKPSWIQAFSAIDATVEAELQDDQRHRLRELLVLDDSIAAMVNTISATGLADDTTIFFTSDNGMMLGEHRIVGGSVGFRAIRKNVLYDPALRAPLVAVGPSFLHETVTVPTQQQDITATIHALSGTTPVLANQSGISLVAAADDPSSYTSRQLLHRRNSTGDGLSTIPSADAITTMTRKLIKYNGTSDPDQYEMYDLDTDPDELVNVAYDGARAAERATLASALTALLA
jgi:N-acetylglucosamine-6-sulfatase